MLSWILAVPLRGRDTNPSLWTVSFPHTFDKDDARTVHWFLPWAGDLHVGAPVSQSECFWSESMYEIAPKKSSSSWEHWPNTDLSMCCCWQSPSGVQAKNCASEKAWTVHLPYVLVMKKYLKLEFTRIFQQEFPHNNNGHFHWFPQ